MFPFNKKIKLILMLGFVSLFSDMSYEGARSIAGPYLGSLGASGAVIGFVFGFGEFISYAFRFISGYFIDKSRRYWLAVFIGYLCNIIAIPSLAFVGHWQAAIILLLIERVGKAIRDPSRNAMLSYASSNVGQGQGFGLHQALDQAGGILGPLLLTAVLYYQQSYQLAFAVLALPALSTLACLIMVRNQYPHPEKLETMGSLPVHGHFPKVFWLYLLGASLMAAGFADYPIIAFHFQKIEMLSTLWIPVFYAIAMTASTISTLFFGMVYDRFGIIVLLFVIFLSAFFAPLVFYGNFYFALLGMIMWGLSMGAQRSLFKAIIADMIPKPNRGTAYGVFNTGYGLAWFLGSWLIGFLYDISIFWLVVFVIITQLCALPIIWLVNKRLVARG